MDNAGGREEGDVELALFRRIRSLSNISGCLSNTRNLRSPGAAYRRYLQHPLSMFSNDRSTDHPQEQDKSSQDKLQTPTNEQPSATPAPSPHPSLDTQHVDDNPVHDHLRRSISSGVDWRDALIQACATMLGKTVTELQVDCHAAVAASPSPNTPFSSDTAAFEPSPRDLADYAIVTTLKSHDPFAMQNASSWLFNMMDRTGAGYVLREEFVRYSPFIGPVADAAVASIVFDELIREQVRIEAEEQQRSSSSGNQRTPQYSAQVDRTSRDRRIVGIQPPASIRMPAQNSLRNRRLITHPLPQDIQGPSTASTPLLSTTASRSSNKPPLPSSLIESAPSDILVPSSLALRFDIWRRFFLAVQDKHHYKDEDWVRVKREIGIDPNEVLIKSQGALDHSDIFPTLGKLYLSQRYLIFFAAVGRNHYVARLGAVAHATTGSIPLMMRDCLRVHLETETKAALDGVSAVVKEDNSQSPSEGNGSPGSDSNSQEEMLSQYVGKLMRQFTAGSKPLVFSLLEFREKKRRDNWLNLILEMVAAHKLHVQFGFGTSGRAVPSLQKTLGEDSEVSEDEEDVQPHNEEKHKTQTLNYRRSPFRNEPSPPLLVVAAHANIVRYRSLRRVTLKRVSGALLIFSHAEKNPDLVNWYTDSVRAYDNQNGRTWIERALSSIRDNMDMNDRMYRVQDDEPFDVRKLGDAIGRFAELCSPLVRVIQFFIHLLQWRNPPATVLAILVCITIATNGLVNYVPAGLFFLQALWVVETKYNWLGLGMGGSKSEDAEQRQANVLALFAQVHDTLSAAQNVLFRLNRELGKVQSLFLWGCPSESDSWVAVAFLCGIGFILLLVPTQTLFLFLVFFSFFKHFLPPTNAGLRFWQSIPSKIEPPQKKGEVVRRRSKRMVRSST